MLVMTAIFLQATNVGNFYVPEIHDSGKLKYEVYSSKKGDRSPLNLPVVTPVVI
jgi:hypothetical protein